ncbi:MAG: hypothetical protein HZC54_14595 [Verrucomicrobia bacterium]|nr:hypothetical protein [Verrucomicrobiota bacterium]
MKAIIAKHQARIGRRGGSVSSEAKRLAARRNALLRWGRKPEEAVIPIGELKDGQWYRGIGRNASLGRWDEKTRCFWVVVFNDFADPARFPEGSIRQVRLKQEDYFTATSGTFKPHART